MSELRIVAGAWRGRRIKVPPKGVRPTADRVREAWMSIVQPAIPDGRVLDLCAGSGALGLEALSRGALMCDFIEQDPAVLRVLQENIAALGATERSRVHRGEVLGVLDELTRDAQASPPFDVAFADPPYRTELAVALATRWLDAPFAAIFGIEHSAAIQLPVPGPDARMECRRYGDTALTIYRSPS